MLGQLEMDVDECISAYSELMATVFGEKLHQTRFGWCGNVKPQFDSEKLRAAITKVIEGKDHSPEDPFIKREGSGCRVYYAPHAFMINLGKLTQTQFRVCCFARDVYDSANSELPSD